MKKGLIYLMALYVEVPKDFDEIKQKIVAGLTKRQLISFGIAAAVGGLTYWATVGKIGSTNASYCLAVVAAPIALFGIYHHNGLYLEQKLKLMYEYRKSEKAKTYQSESIYDVIDKAIEYRKLKRIVREYERRSK